MRLTKDRCDHCGRWVPPQELYTLFELANGHPESESVAICHRCCDERKPVYWEQWLNKRFAAIEVGKIYRTNLSKLGGLVKVLEIAPYAPDSTELAAWIEHIEDHPYGYKKGDRGWYMVADLVQV